MNVKAAIYACCPAPLRPLWHRIEASPLGYRLAKGAFWSLAGTAISRGLALLASMVVARMLGQEGFGELGIVQNTVVMFATFAGFGMGMTATKHVAEFRAKDPRRAGRFIALSGAVAIVTAGVLTILLVVLAPWLAAESLERPDLTMPLICAAPLLLLISLNGAQNGALSGFEAFKALAQLNFISGVASFPLTIVGAWWGGLNGAILGQGASAGFAWIINHIGLRRQCRKHGVPFTMAGLWEERGVLVSFSIPAVFAGVMVGPVTWLCCRQLATGPDGWAEMGIFNAASQWFALVLTLPAVLGQVILPIGAERLSSADKASATKILSMSMKVNALVALPIVLAGSVLSPWIMGCYGESYQSGWPTLIVILLTGGIVAVQTPVGQTLVASGRLWTGFLMNTGWAAIFIVLTFFLVPIGAVGLALARLMAYTLHAGWTFWYAYRVVREYAENDSGKDAAPCSIGSAVAATSVR